jgi:hypothetical protein
MRSRLTQGHLSTYPLDPFLRKIEAKTGGGGMTFWLEWLPVMIVSERLAWALHLETVESLLVITK